MDDEGGGGLDGERLVVGEVDRQFIGAEPVGAVGWGWSVEKWNPRASMDVRWDSQGRGMNERAMGGGVIICR